jgi:hypothetical protein
MGGCVHTAAFPCNALCILLFCCPLPPCGCPPSTASDCGAGVGRVSEQLLLHHFNTVDLLEPSRHLLDAAQKNLKAAVAGGSFPQGHSLGQCLCQGLQEFDPQPGRCDACCCVHHAAFFPRCLIHVFTLRWQLCT